MHYTTSYEGLSDIEKHNKAIEDIKEYTGVERFNKITEEFKKSKQISIEQFTLMVSFAGVRGYPVKAWYNYIYGL